ncbi:hypothetical protein HU200_013855 [Digitaria exilis]|uniref:Isochorismatase-like domain-containing protein n=1 Tax=Digitaria exilis TaxID=1010633 RepID=A0A835KJA8_9POAL|nr:hypothetical protein HU200_013855 [Digitaria exilis]
MGATVASKWSDTAMLVIDMQKEFVDPATSSLALLAGKAILPAVTEAVEHARGRGIFVVWVVREHDSDGRDVELLRRRFYSGGKGPAMKGSKGAELADGLVIKEQDYKLVKTRFSSFFATNLDSVLKLRASRTWLLLGLRHQTVSGRLSLMLSHWIMRKSPLLLMQQLLLTKKSIWVSTRS